MTRPIGAEAQEAKEATGRARRYLARKLGVEPEEVAGLAGFEAAARIAVETVALTQRQSPDLVRSILSKYNAPIRCSTVLEGDASYMAGTIEALIREVAPACYTNAKVMTERSSVSIVVEFGAAPAMTVAELRKSGASRKQIESSIVTMLFRIEAEDPKLNPWTSPSFLPAKLKATITRGEHALENRAPGAPVETTIILAPETMCAAVARAVRSELEFYSTLC